MTSHNHRRNLLNTADSLINGDRNVQYGDPTDDFSRTARYWNIHLGGILRRRLSQYMEADETSISIESLCYIVETLLDPHDVAIMMMQLKHSRLSWSPTKEDHWIDLAGYAACGWDCVVRAEGDWIDE